MSVFVSRCLCAALALAAPAGEQAARASTLTTEPTAAPPPSSAASAPTGPLPTAWEQAFASVVADPRPPALVRDTHYIVSNEDNHYVFQRELSGRGGVFIGVGTDQNYVMAGWARPEMMVLMDFDQVVVDLHRVYRVLFLNAPTPQDFLDLWDERNVHRVEAMIDGQQTDAATKAGMLRAYRIAHYSVPRRLRRIEAMYRPLGVRWFLNDIEQYRYVVDLFRNNRVLIVRGDLSVGGTMASIGAAAQRAGAVVRIVYLSNAERYFPYTAGFRRGILSLPTDGRSLVVRTRARLNGSYEYILQDASNFRRWLEWGKMSYAVEMTRWREPESAGSLAYVIRRLPPGSEPSATPAKAPAATAPAVPTPPETRSAAPAAAPAAPAPGVRSAALPFSR